MFLLIGKVVLSVPKVISRAASLGRGITVAQFAISYKDFFDCFETYPALRAPLSERGGCRIATIFATIGYKLYYISSLLVVI